MGFTSGYCFKMWDTAMKLVMVSILAFTSAFEGIVASCSILAFTSVSEGMVGCLKDIFQRVEVQFLTFN